MTLLPPTSLTTHLLYLIDHADTTLTVVSPAARLKRGCKLYRRLEAVRRRGVHVRWYYRADQEVGRTLRRLGIEAVPVESLNCKLYLNERQAIVTSLNLPSFGDAIDIGYLTQDATEYAELVQFITAHVLPAAVPTPSEKPTTPPLTVVAGPGHNTDRIASRVNTLVHDYVRERVRTGLLEEDQVRYHLRGLAIDDYYPNISLKIDVRPRYDRLILQPRGNNKAKTATYGYLAYHKDVLARTLVQTVKLGTQMKRLKIPLPADARTLDGQQRLSPEYRALLTGCLDRAFGPLRELLRSLMAPEYYAVG